MKYLCYIKNCHVLTKTLHYEMTGSKELVLFLDQNGGIRVKNQLSSENAQTS